MNQNPNFSVPIYPFDWQGVESCWPYQAPKGAIKFAKLCQAAGGLVVCVETIKGDRSVVACPATFDETKPLNKRWTPDLFSLAVLRPNIARALVRRSGDYALNDSVRDTINTTVLERPRKSNARENAPYEGYWA